MEAEEVLLFKIWKTRDGEELLIKKMETSHLKNTVELLKKYLKKCEDIKEKIYFLNYIMEMQSEIIERLIK